MLAPEQRCEQFERLGEQWSEGDRSPSGGRRAFAAAVEAVARAANTAVARRYCHSKQVIVCVCPRNTCTCPLCARCACDRMRGTPAHTCTHDPKRGDGERLAPRSARPLRRPSFAPFPAAQQSAASAWERGRGGSGVWARSCAHAETQSPHAHTEPHTHTHIAAHLRRPSPRAGFRCSSSTCAAACTRGEKVSAAQRACGARAGN